MGLHLQISGVWKFQIKLNNIEKPKRTHRADVEQGHVVRASLMLVFK